MIDMLEVEFSYELDHLEQRFLHILAKEIKNSDKARTSYDLNVISVLHQLGFRGPEDFQYLSAITTRLCGSVLQIDSLNNDSVIQTTWLTKAAYYHNEPCLSVQIDENLKQFYLHLKDNTQPFNYMALLKSQFAKRMYYILTKSGSLNYTKRFSVEELRLHLDATKPSYSQYGDFKRRVLAPAVDEINRKTNIMLSYESIKTVRKITDVVIKVQEKEQY